MMKKFIIRIIIFVSCLGLLFAIVMFLPATPKSKSNMLSYKPQKDSLLLHTESPRMIFIGGSNLVFGLNSQMVKDSLELNPINAGLAINIGLIYMMDDILPYIRSGDQVVLAPEYQLYFGKAAYGNNDLLRLLMDVDRSGFSKLRSRHLPNMIKVMPNYFISKIDPENYFYKDQPNPYRIDIFNQYGDSDFHWDLESRDFPQLRAINSGFNHALLKEIITFNQKIKDKGAVLWITFPGCQASSLDVIDRQISKVQDELEKTELKVLGTPRRYAMPDSVMFDSPYHLIREGVDRRTELFIEDFNAKN